MVLPSLYQDSETCVEKNISARKPIIKYLFYFLVIKHNKHKTKHYNFIFNDKIYSYSTIEFEQNF